MARYGTGGAVPGGRRPNTGGTKPSRGGAFTAPRKPRKAKKPKKGTVGTLGRPKGPKKPKRSRKQPYDPLQPLQGREFNREVRRGTRLKYAPEQAQIGVERRISKQQMANIPHWYDQYLALSEQMRQATAQGYQQAQAGVNAQTARSVGQDTALNQQVQAEAQQSAALRGTKADPGVGAQALAARTALSNQMSGLIASHGASQNAFGATRTAAGGAAKLGALREEQGKRSTIEGAARQLARERGDYASQLRGSLREGERKYALERSAFGLDVAEARERKRSAKAREKQNRRNTKLVARDKAIDNMREDAKFRQDLREFGADEAERRFRRRLDTRKERRMGASGGSSSDGLPPGVTPAQRRKHQNSFGNWVDRVKASGKGYQHNYEYMRKQGVPIDLARAIAQRGTGGFPSSREAQKLWRKYGVKTRARKPTTRRPKRPGPQTS